MNSLKTVLKLQYFHLSFKFLNQRSLDTQVPDVTLIRVGRLNICKIRRSDGTRRGSETNVRTMGKEIWLVSRATGSPFDDVGKE